ncbi:MAG: DUF2165 family protein [Halieaceae bacterium]|nr:DUF2165 family protein [Halieaceae bacterium]
MLKLTKIFLIAAVCLWGAIGALGNVLGWQGTLGAVGAATSMAGFVENDWRATSNSLVILAGALCIVGFKLASATLCGLGASQMWADKGADSERFAVAKQLAVAGCGVAVFGLFFGWIVLGEQWFEMWRSPDLASAGESAFRYGGFIGIIGIFVALPEA